MGAVKCYFSGIESQLHFQHCVDAKVKHVLTSFWQFHNKDRQFVKRRKKKHPEINFMIDSGAHTMITEWQKFAHWTQKMFENYVNDYVKWVFDNRRYLTCAVELDIDHALNMIVAGNENSSLGTSVVESWQKGLFAPLKRKGIDIIYVWHEQRGMDGWEEMCAKHDYVGLPGVLSSNPDFNKFIAVARRYTTRIHGFAATKQLDFRDVPWHCMTDAHEILTKDGWKTRSSIQRGDLVLTYKDGVSSWKPVDKVVQFDVTNCDIHCFDSRTFSTEVTANHRWLSFRQRGRLKERNFEWRRTSELTNDDAIPRKADYSGPTDRVFCDAFVELVAWTWTEGTYTKRNGLRHPLISISQSVKANPEKVKAIRHALIRLGDDFHEWFSVSDDCAYFGITGELKKRLHKWCPGKRLLLGFIMALTPEQLKLFVKRSVEADGTKTPRATDDFTFLLTQKDDVNLDVFEIACILSGYAVNRTESHKKHGVGTSNVDWVYPRHADETIKKFTGKVWCIEVENHTFLTRCNQKVYWTGNSIDSITWKTGEMYGTLIDWDKNTQKLSFLDKPRRKEVYNKMKLLGFDADAVVNDTNYKEVTRYSLFSMRQMEAFYEDRYSNRIQYHQLRLPHHSVIGSMVRDELNNWWSLFRPDVLFQQHSNQSLDKIKVFLAALSAAQNGETKFLRNSGEMQAFLKAYFPKLVDPYPADIRILQRELSVYVAPPNPPPLQRSAPEHWLPSVAAPKMRDELIDPDDLAFDLPESHFLSGEI